MRQRAKRFGVKDLERRQVADLDPQQVFKGPGGVVTFDNFGRGDNGALKRLLCSLVLGRQADMDIGDKATAQCLQVQPRMIAGDDPGALKLLHPAQTGWR